MSEKRANEIVAKLMRLINKVPVAQRTHKLTKVLSDHFKGMTRPQIKAIRARLVATYSDHPAFEAAQQTLDLIDGQLALREIAGRKHWR